MPSGLEISKVIYRFPKLFAVEIRKYHQKIPLERYYILERCKIAIRYKLAILEQCKLAILYGSSNRQYSLNATRLDIGLSYFIVTNNIVRKCNSI